MGRCRLCHQDITVRFQAENPHNIAARDVDSTNVTGCETCHGGGGLHVSSMNAAMIGRFGQGEALAESSACLGCHAEGPAHADRFTDPHQDNAVACSSCHSVHTSEPATRLLRASANTLCTGCHASEAARFLQPFAHPVDTFQSASSVVECIDCHSPHGGESAFSLLGDQANQTVCLTCHSDKRGPFAFEHLPMVTGDGCTSCHEPHGSPNPRMLVRSSVSALCLECHTNSISAFGQTPPAFHDLRTMRFQNCTVCHTRIHGSHASPAFLR
jgi:DmsE family decaheme c-type cytochrome